MSQTIKNAQFATLKNPLNIPRPGSRERFNDTFFVQRQISGNIFMKLQSVVLCEVANKQTNKEKHSLLCLAC